MNLKSEQVDKLSNLTVQLSLVEVIIGSFLHGFKIPLAGHVLSLNQGIFLIRSQKIATSRAEAIKFPVYISTVCATMKSLSPAGNKLGPMISISSQGFLFSSGILIAGKNLLGQSLGMFLLSLWSLIQPFITFYILYGSDLFLVVSSAFKKIQDSLGVPANYIILTIGCLIGLKIFFAVLIPFYFRKKAEQEINQELNHLFDKLNTKKGPKYQKYKFPKMKTKNAFILAILDLFNPLFIFSLFLMFCFFYFSESEWTQIFWKLLRPIAISFIFFYISRNKLMNQLFQKIKNRGYFKNFFYLLEKVSSKLKLKN